MKKSLSIITLLFMLLNLCACGNRGDSLNKEGAWYGEESFINDCNREYIGMPGEEIVIVNGCRVIIKYADEENPEALNEMRALLEKQRMIPKSISKFDDDESI